MLIEKQMRGGKMAPIAKQLTIPLDLIKSDQSTLDYLSTRSPEMWIC